MKLKLLESTYAVCRLDPTSASATEFKDLGGDLFSITRTPDEISIVCEQSRVPRDPHFVAKFAVKVETDWRVLKVEGTLDFALTGILASITKPLAAAKISVFTISTFDTDYVLVKSATLDAAKASLSAAGFAII